MPGGNLTWSREKAEEIFKDVHGSVISEVTVDDDTLRIRFEDHSWITL